MLCNILKNQVVSCPSYPIFGQYSYIKFLHENGEYEVVSRTPKADKRLYLLTGYSILGSFFLDFLNGVD